MQRRRAVHDPLAFIIMGIGAVIGGVVLLISTPKPAEKSVSSRELTCEFGSEILSSGEKSMTCMGRGIEGQYVTIELLDKEGKRIGYDNVSCAEQFGLNTFVPQRTYSYKVYWQNE